MSPARAILLHSPGRKPWVKHWHIFIEPPTGAALPRRKADARAGSAAPTELNLLLSMCTQGSVRAYGTLTTLGFAGVSCLKALAPAPT